MFLPIESTAQSRAPVIAARCSNDSVGVTSVHELKVPEKALAACRKGTERFAAKDSAGSISEFQKAIKAYPDYYEAYAKLGAAELDIDHWQHAEADFRKSLELSNGRYAPADFGLGLILATVKNQFTAAERSIRDGLDLDPGDVTGNFVLAWVLYSTTRLQEAEKSAREALSLAPNFAGAQLLLAQIHLGERNLAEAVDDLNAYLSFGISGPLDEKAREVRERALQELSQQKSGPNAAGNSANTDRANFR